MKTITYKVRDPQGIHARPAGILAKKMSHYKSQVFVEKNGNKADAKGILAIMGLNIRQGETITITIDGEDEDIAVKEVSELLCSLV